MGRKIKKRQAGLGDGGRARMRHTAVFAPLTVRESLAPLKYKDDAWGARLFEQVLRCTRCLEMLQRKSHYFYQARIYTRACFVEGVFPRRCLLRSSFAPLSVAAILITR